MGRRKCVVDFMIMTKYEVGIFCSSFFISFLGPSSLGEHTLRRVPKGVDRDSNLENVKWEWHTLRSVLLTL